MVGKMAPEQDIRDLIFASVKGKKFIAQISARGEGIISGVEWLKKACDNLGINLKKWKKNGARVRPADIVAILEGDAKQMARGEEELIGWISKASGIATAAARRSRPRWILPGTPCLS